MQHYSSQAFTDIGKPAGGASIAIKIAGTNTNATIYSDDGVTVKSNPFVTNSLGQFDFYSASGKYDITVSGTQITTYTLPNQVVFDPFEQSSGDTAVALRSLSLNAFTGPLTIPSGQVLSADQIVPLNSSGFGGFWAPTVWLPSTVVTSANFVNNANEVWVFQFVLPYKAQIGKVSYNIQSGVAATVGDVGIYSITGNLLANTGGFSTASSNTTATANLLNAPITLSAGIYYFAQTNSGGATVTSVGLTTGTQLPGIMTSGGSKTFGLAANASVAGVLPPTLGVVTLSSARLPIFVYFER